MFLRRLVASTEFRRRLLDIGFIERERELVCGTSQPAPDARVLAAAALWTLAGGTAAARRCCAASAWSTGDGWRLNGQLTRTLLFESGASSGEAASVAVQYRPDGYQLRAERFARGRRSRAAPRGDDEFHLRYGALGGAGADRSGGRGSCGWYWRDEFRLRRRDPLRTGGGRP